ncbi:MAG: HlyD family efflux transporter periplasmic adaptor subunit [Cyclobacteriaceae bacterium]|nr:HlyD family efflux transporter periplasmic adaptor subunit [Cyclobacteriaceae bacterium]
MKRIFNLNLLSVMLTSMAFWGCQSNNHDADAYGNFEATEILVSSEASAKLIQFKVDEGQLVEQGQMLGFADTTQLYLQKQQIIYSIAALKSKTQDVGVQVRVLIAQKNNLSREKKRIENLLKDGATTAKQLDDINGEIEVTDSRILATRSQLTTANAGILSEIAPLEAQVELINDQLTKSYITSPVSGTVLTKYAEEGELVVMGQPLFKVADLREMTLRAYIGGDQLSDLKLGSQVEVWVDQDKDNYRSFTGTISWISPQAEFTPKIIQTKEERVNLVYAVKVKVPNDQTLKIGMPGEVKFK